MIDWSTLLHGKIYFLLPIYIILLQLGESFANFLYPAVRFDADELGLSSVILGDGPHDIDSRLVDVILLTLALSVYLVEAVYLNSNEPISLRVRALGFTDLATRSQFFRLQAQPRRCIYSSLLLFVVLHLLNQGLLIHHATIL